MSTPAPPIIAAMVHGTLKLSTFAMECWINSAVLSQSTDMQDVKTLCPDSTGSSPGTTAYQLDVTYYADEQTGGPSEFLWQNHGQSVTFEFNPYADAGADSAVYTGSCYAMWGGTGGAAGELAAVDVTLPIVGKPARAQGV